MLDESLNDPHDSPHKTSHQRSTHLRGADSVAPRAYPPLALLGAILVAAAALDLIQLGARSLWLDEATSVTFARLGWQPLLQILSREEANMSLYYGLLHLWVTMGDSEYTIRLLSVLMAVGAVGAIYLLGKKLFSPRVGLVAALLLAVNAFLVAYAQQARSYSLLAVLVTGTSLAFAEAIERPTWTWWAVYTAAAVSAVYAHFFGVLVLLAHGISLAFLPKRQVPWKHVLVSAAVVGLCISPLALFAMSHPGKAGGIPKPRREDIIWLFYSLTGAGPTGAKLLVAAYGLACTIPTWIAITRREWRYWFLLTWFVVPIVLTLAVSVVKPLFLPYYLIVCLPPLTLMAATGISNLPRGALAIALVAIVGMALYEDWQYHRQSPVTEDWRAAISFVVTHAAPKDALFFYPVYLRQVYDYYRPAAAPPVVFPQHWDWVRTAAYGEPVEGSAQAVSLIKVLPQTYYRVWVFSHYDGISPSVRAALTDAYRPVEKLDFHGVAVTLYTRGH